jgi:hypothetical protein
LSTDPLKEFVVSRKTDHATDETECVLMTKENTKHIEFVIPSSFAEFRQKKKKVLVETAQQEGTKLCCWDTFSSLTLNVTSTAAPI